jgi:hypothetical protein
MGIIPKSQSEVTCAVVGCCCVYYFSLCMSANEHIMVAQNSQYWNSWIASKLYTLQINIYSAKIECDATSVRSGVTQFDPYIVCFLDRDRSQSKKKTSILKKTLNPEWNECVLFSELDITEKMCIELKTPSWYSYRFPGDFYTLTIQFIGAQ